MNICVYGASSTEVDNSYVELVEKLGEEMAKRGHTLVFGGGSGGMMGAVARGIDKVGGKIVGVVPTFFNVDGILYENCDEMIRPLTMRERKQIMEDRSDAFITTPGGIGTFEEFFEILTLKQLGRHEKAIVILDVNGYYDDMIGMMENAIHQKFMTEAMRNLYYKTDDVHDALNYIENYSPKKFNILELKHIPQ